jgi:hypothetical protein
MSSYLSSVEDIDFRGYYHRLISSCVKDPFPESVKQRMKQHSILGCDGKMEEMK